MAANIRPVRRQHTVTKRLLKEFCDGQGKLAVLDTSYGVRRLRTPGSAIFTIQFDTFDSRGAEERWNIFENRFPAALKRIDDRTALDDEATVATLRDMLALHWSRSAAIKLARERVMARLVEEHKRSMVQSRPKLLQRALLKEVGLVAASAAELEWLSDKVHDRVMAENSAMWNSHRDPVNFAAARTHFESFSVQIGYARNHDLLISDCPVITTTSGIAGTGPHHGIGLYSADHIAMPVGPRVVIGLGPRAELLDLEEDVVDQYNAWQREAAVEWIAARPGGLADISLVVAEQLAAQMRRLGPPLG